jgi:hypothetical protein
MDDEVFVFFFSLIIPGDHEQASAVKFLTSPEQRAAFSFFNFGALDVVTDLDERGDFSRFFEDKIDLCPTGIPEIVKIGSSSQKLDRHKIFHQPSGIGRNLEFINIDDSVIVNIDLAPRPELLFELEGKPSHGENKESFFQVGKIVLHRVDALKIENILQPRLENRFCPPDLFHAQRRMPRVQD